MSLHTQEVERAAAPPPAAQHEEDAALEPVYVWDLVVRACHWVIVFSFVILTLTGIYIGRPFIIAGSFTMGWMKVVHYYASIAFALAVAARLAWMLLGPPQARWHQFVPVTKQRWRELIGTLKFYMFLARRPPPTMGHNAMAGAAYVGVFGLYLLMIFTGFALYSVSAYGSYMKMWSFLLPIFGGIQGARWLHHVAMWLLIGFIVQHIFSSVLMARVEKNGTLDSIFSGWKFLPRKDRR
jgi:Ni/Fe-hydrogenase 1 B-type cytochrome subunit